MVIDTEFRIEYPIDRVVLAVQDTIERLEWSVLTMSSTLIVALGPPPMAGAVIKPKLTVQLREEGEVTAVKVTGSMNGFIMGAKKHLTGCIGQFTNSVSLRAQTNSLIINPTVAVGDGQGAAASATATSNAADDRVAQLERLKALLDAGVLDADEFQAEKRRILNT